MFYKGKGINLYDHVRLDFDLWVPNYGKLSELIGRDPTEILFRTQSFESQHDKYTISRDTKGTILYQDYTQIDYSGKLEFSADFITKNVSIITLFNKGYMRSAYARVNEKVRERELSPAMFAGHLVSKKMDHVQNDTYFSGCAFYLPEDHAPIKLMTLNMFFDNCSFRTKPIFESGSFSHTRFKSCGFSDGLILDYTDHEFEDQIGGNARTLTPSYFTDLDWPELETHVHGEDSPKYVKQHENGWTLKAVICEDYYYWVNEFEAKHPQYGEVSGDFESEVYASSPEAIVAFLGEFSYSEWDYQDI